MKAKQRIFLVLLALIAAAGIVFGLLTLQNKKAEQAASEAADGTIPLAAVTANDLSRIAITYNGETNTLNWDGTSWTLTEDPAYHLDTSACNTLLTALSGFNAKRELTPQAGEDYGFDASTLTVAVTADGQTDTFTFGASNTVTGDFYLRKNGEDTVYTVSGNKAACFELTKADLFGAFNPAGLTNSAIEGISYTLASGETVTLKANSEPAADSDSDTEYKTVWRLADDSTADLNETKVNAILSALSSYASGQVTGADPAEYGFDAPLAVYTVTTAESTTTLTYAMGTDGCYLMVEGDSSIYIVDGSAVTNLLVTADDLKTE